MKCPNCKEEMKEKIIGNICPKCDYYEEVE